MIDPLGNELIQPLWDQPGIIMADLLSDVLVQSKMDFDVVGHYARNDLFR